MRLQLDTNIIIDLLLERVPFFVDAHELLIAAKEHYYTLFLSATSVTDIFYIIRKNAGKEKAFKEVERLVNDFEICDVTKLLLLNALATDFSDFEDTVQHETALASNIDVIITRNKKDFKHSKIKVLTPKEFMKHKNF